MFKRLLFFLLLFLGAVSAFAERPEWGLSDGDPAVSSEITAHEKQSIERVEELFFEGIQDITQGCYIPSPDLTTLLRRRHHAHDISGFHFGVMLINRLGFIQTFHDKSLWFSTTATVCSEISHYIFLLTLF